MRQLLSAPAATCRLGQSHGVGRGLAVSVGADLRGPRRRRGRAADHDEEVVPSAGRGEVLDHLPLLGHGRGHQGAERDDVGARVDGRGHEPGRGHVDAQVDHLEAGGPQHRDDDVLAERVDVALDGADDDLALAPRRAARLP